MLNGVKVTMPKTKTERARRPHNRTTIITTDRKSFMRLREMAEGQTLTVTSPNDIISSARGGASDVHHSIRRVALLRRQISGGYNRVRVRFEQGNEIACTMTGNIVGEDDGSTFKVSLKR